MIFLSKYHSSQGRLAHIIDPRQDKEGCFEHLALELVKQAEDLQELYSGMTHGGELKACWVNPGTGEKRLHKDKP